MTNKPSINAAKAWKAVAGALEGGARGAAIFIHLTDELLDAGEFSFRPDPIDEGNVDRSAVEIIGKIEQEHFEQNRPLVECRAPAEARHAVVAAPVDADAYRVDAMGEAASRIEPQVGRGIAERAPAFVAVHDLAAHEPRSAEERIRLGDPAGAQRGADEARAHQSSGIFEARHDVDCESELAPCAAR